MSVLDDAVANRSSRSSSRRASNIPLYISTLQHPLVNHSMGSSSLPEHSSSNYSDGSSVPDKKSLLRLSNRVRANMRAGHDIGIDSIELVRYISQWNNAEKEEKNSADFATIHYAHLDKLLQDLQNPIYMSPSKHPHLLCLVIALQKAWRHRFREFWFRHDELRATYVRDNCLRGIEYCGPQDDELEVWRAKNTDIEPAADDEFAPGDWWYNLACAHRDGIVGSSSERPTIGVCGIRVVPLLTGEEDVISEGRSRYTRHGSLGEMCFSLMKEVGFPVRILRGYRLKSKLAPQGGVRYDGLYKIASYSYNLDHDVGKHRLRLELVRLPEQQPLLDSIPTPAQLDEWDIFQRHESEVVKRRVGSTTWLTYKVKMDEERHAKVRWRQAMEFRESLKPGNEKGKAVLT